MRFIAKFCTVLLAVALVHSAAWAVSFNVSLDRDSMTLGEQATLSLKFEGVQPQDAPGIPNITGLNIEYVGPSTAFSFINGETTSSVTYNYVVTARQDGNFTIPALQANVNGQVLTSAAIRLTVRKPDAPGDGEIAAGREPVFMKLLVPKDKYFLGEPFVAQLEVYLREDVQGLNGFQLTSTPTDGFNAGKLAEDQGKRHRSHVGNHNYTVIPLAMPLTPIRPGALTLGPFTANLTISLPSGNQGGDPFFRQFFNQTEQKQLTIASTAVTVQIVPLPDQNKPANFTGAVGDFTLTATAGPTNVTVGDPITVHIQIAGRGTFDSVSLGDPGIWHDFKTYPPTTKLDTSDTYGLQGTKTFEQIVSPQNSDVHQLPAISFSFFNPDDGQYHTLTQPAISLVVHAASATPLPTIAGIKNSSDNQPPQDILPIKDQLGTLAANTSPLVTRPGFLALQCVPLLAFLGTLVWRRQADNLANNPRLRRRRAVTQLVATGLQDLKKFAAANQPDPFFATLFRLLQEQLGERLDCPATAITENVIDEHTLLRGAPAPLRDALREQFQLCNQARYAPVRGTAELNSVAAQFEKLLRELQELKA